MKRTKYQVQRRTNINGDEVVHNFGRKLFPLSALKLMEELAFYDIRAALINGEEVTISRTSDSRYPDSWGYACNGILIRIHSNWSQWEVVEV